MTDQREWRIRQLEKEVGDLKALRDQLIGVTWAGKWGLRFLFALGGYGMVEGFGKIIHWLQAPLKVGFNGR